MGSHMGKLTEKLIIRIEPRMGALYERAARASKRNRSDWVRLTLDEAAVAALKSEGRKERGIHASATATGKRRAAEAAEAAPTAQSQTPAESP